MTDRPIIFSGPMARALLSGEKTQTRRLLRNPPPSECSIHFMVGNESWMPVEDRTPLRHSWEAWGGPLYENRPERHMCGSHTVKMPWTPGDRLWVKETLRRAPHLWTYAADGAEVGWPARAFLAGKERDVVSPIHCFRVASRATLTVTDVRVQRLQEISEDDARAEGARLAFGEWFDAGFCQVPADKVPQWTLFAGLWEKLHGPGAWAENPWIVAVSFTVQHGNIDALQVAA